MEDGLGLDGWVLLNYLFQDVHGCINFPGSDIILYIFIVHDALREVLALDSLVNVVWFVVEVALVLKDVEEWTDISIGEVLAFEANGGDEVVLVVDVGGFGEEALGGEFELFFKQSDFIFIMRFWILSE